MRKEQKAILEKLDRLIISLEQRQETDATKGPDGIESLVRKVQVAVGEGFPPFESRPPFQFPSSTVDETLMAGDLSLSTYKYLQKYNLLETPRSPVVSKARVKFNNPPHEYPMMNQHYASRILDEEQIKRMPKL